VFGLNEEIIPPRDTGGGMPVIPSGVATISGGDKKDFHLSFLITKKKKQSVEGHIERLICVGHIQYEDVFGEKHDTSG
jgi:hypothetical protein